MTECKSANHRKIHRRTDIIPGGTSSHTIPVNQQYNNTVAGAVLDMQRSGQFTDFTIHLANGKRIQCHKMILAIACPFFKTALNSALKESKTNQMDLTHLDSEVLQDIVQYFYTGEIEIKWDGIERLVEAATFLILDQLKEQCEKRIFTEVKEESSLHWYELACLFDFNDIKKRCETSYFQQICFSDHFKTLPFKDVLRIIQLDEIKVDTEDTVLQACIEWVSHDVENRKSEFKKLASHIRIHYCHSEYLDRVVKEHRNVMPTVFKSKATRTKLAKSHAKMPRLMQSVEKVLLVFSGYLNCDTFDPYDRCSWYLHPSGKWIEFKSRFVDNTGLLCSVTNGFIAVEHNGVVRKHDTITQENYILCKLGKLMKTDYPKHIKSCVVVEQKLYVFGYMFNKDKDYASVVVCVDFGNEKCEGKPCTSVPIAGSFQFCDLCLVAVGMQIYVLSHRMRNISGFHCYDIQKDTWKKLACPSYSAVDGGYRGYHKDGNLIFAPARNHCTCLAYNIFTEEWTSLCQVEHANFVAAAKHISHIKLKDEIVFVACVNRVGIRVDKKRALSLSTLEWKNSTMAIPRVLTSCAQALWVDMPLLSLGTVVMDDEQYYEDAETPYESSGYDESELDFSDSDDYYGFLS